MPYGIPLTEEERKRNHDAMYGTTKLPERGTGMQNIQQPKQPTGADAEREFEVKPVAYKETVSDKLTKKASLVADLLTIKMNNLFPWYYVVAGTITDETSTTMYSEKVPNGYLRVLTHVSALVASTATTTTEIAIERGGQTIILTRQVPSAADISIDFDGQAILINGDRLKVTFYGGTSTNVTSICASGYEIKA